LTGAIIGVLLLLAILLIVTTAYLAAKARTDREPGRPDEISDEVMTRLIAELRKWQAEAAHWKATAERLQRELDQRQ
jgi:uncharacterized protein YlxW (UPF0749 family)